MGGEQRITSYNKNKYRETIGARAIDGESTGRGAQGSYASFRVGVVVVNLAWNAA